MKSIRLFSILALLLAMSLVAGCSCGDDDDDSGGDDVAGDDDATDDDVADDDASDDDVSDDDVTDDDASDDDDDDDDNDAAPLNLVPPVDYDGDGDVELLMVNIDFTDNEYNVFLVEPGVYSRERILTYPIGTKQGGPHVNVADLDQNGVWDLIVANNQMIPKAGVEAYIDVFLNGKFDTPAFSAGPYADTTGTAWVFDADSDGLLEILVATQWSCGGDGELALIDPDQGFATTATFAFDANRRTNVLTVAAPGEIHHRAANFSGEPGANHLAMKQVEYSSGHNNLFLRIYDLATGNLINESAPMDMYENSSVAVIAADFDDDGATEFGVNFGVHDTTAKIVQTTQFLVFGGTDFTNEYTGTLYTDVRSQTAFVTDINGDGVVDGNMSWTDPSGRGRSFAYMDGTAGYGTLLSYATSGSYTGWDFPWYGRGGVGMAYDFTGDGDNELVVVRQFDEAGPVRTGELMLIDVETNMPSMVLETFPMGESGSYQANVGDIGGDGLIELALSSHESVWNGTAHEYDNYVHVYRGAGIDEIFISYYGDDAATPYPYMKYDMDGDLAADLMIESNGGVQQVNNIYSCDDSGCELVNTISFGPDEHFYFEGPML